MEIGNKVKLISSRHGISQNNPLFGSEYSKSGIVHKISATAEDMPILVKWENGTYNSYSEDDLELYNKEYISVW